MIKLQVHLTPEQTKIHFNQQTLTIYTEQPTSWPTFSGLLCHTAKNQITQIDYLTAAPDPLPTAPFITISDADWPEGLPYLGQLLLEEAPKIKGHQLVEQVPRNYRQTLQPVVESIDFILSRFGYSLTTPTKAKPVGKTRHRWTKAVSQIEFTVATREAVGTAIWQKRNEMVLKAGAKIRPTAPLNQDGSFGFAAKMGTQLRSEHTDQVQDNVTTEDIIFKSVNEIGLFLYFGGTNSWLELVDENGRSIDNWTKI